MLGTNHALTGALIGAFLPLPIAIPVAFASHFVLDATPHYGIKSSKRNKSNTYRLVVLGDTAIALLGSIGLVILHKTDMNITAWVAWSPDLLWVIYYLTHGRDLQIKPKNWFMRKHIQIQWCERGWGIIVELALFGAFLPIYILQLLN